jgi:hypothetical protein
VREAAQTRGRRPHPLTRPVQHGRNATHKVRCTVSAKRFTTEMTFTSTSDFAIRYAAAGMGVARFALATDRHGTAQPSTPVSSEQRSLDTANEGAGVGWASGVRPQPVARGTHLDNASAFSAHSTSGNRFG